LSLSTPLRSVALTIIGLAGGAACAVDRYEGVAYARDSGSITYRETHWLYRDGGVARRLVLYRCADGTPFARKKLTELPSTVAPDFDFYDAGIDYREGVTGGGKHRLVYSQGPGDTTRRQRELDLGADDVVDAGFDAYIRVHWDAITPQVPLHAAIVVPGRLEALPVVITETGGSDPEVRHFVMRLDAWYRLIAPSMTLDYERSTRRLLAFSGVGMIRDASGRNLNVRIRFPAEQHESVGAEDLLAAERATLSTQCHP
jgi:hypothetical protein